MRFYNATIESQLEIRNKIEIEMEKLINTCDFNGIIKNDQKRYLTTSRLRTKVFTKKSDIYTFFSILFKVNLYLHLYLYLCLYLSFSGKPVVVVANVFVS